MDIDADGNFPLCLACSLLDHEKHVYFIEALIKANPNAILQNWENEHSNPLHVVCKIDKPDLALLLLEISTLTLMYVDHMKRTPLQVAINCKHHKVVSVLLKYQRHLNINNIDLHESTALHSADWKIIPKLLEINDINVHIEDGCGMTPFHNYLEYLNRQRWKFTTMGNHRYKIIKMYLEKFPQVLDVKNASNDENLVHKLVGWNNPDILRAILPFITQHILNDKDKYGKTPLHKICQRWYVGDMNDVRGMLENEKQCFDLLLGHSLIKVNKKDQHGCTALHYACRGHKISAVEALLRRKTIQFDSLDDEGETALHSVIRVIDSCSREETASCIENAQTILEMLLNHDNCLIFLKSRDGSTILDYANKRFQKLKGFHTWYVDGALIMSNMQRMITSLDTYVQMGRWKLYHHLLTRS
jgi:ankyrin repeat protein